MPPPLNPPPPPRPPPPPPPPRPPRAKAVGIRRPSARVVNRNPLPKWGVIARLRLLVYRAVVSGQRVSVGRGHSLHGVRRLPDHVESVGAGDGLPADGPVEDFPSEAVLA